ncbi:MAG: radical SAM protein [Pseudomonadota bacterium]
MNHRLDRALRVVQEVNAAALINALVNCCEEVLRRPIPISLPRTVDIALTKACNLRCVQCISYGSAKDSRWLPFDLYERIAATLFHTSLKVEFCSGGEPFLYARIRDALAIARRSRNITDVTSNGMLIGEDVAQWLVEDQTLNDLRISFDGARKETLERIRRGALYEKILRNIKYLTSLRDGNGARYPRLSLRFSIMKSNAEELPELFELCDKHGFERVQVQYLIVANTVDLQESMYFHRQLCEDLFGKAKDLAGKFGVELELPPLMSPEKQTRRCLHPWQAMRIDTDGSIRFCGRSWRQRIGFWDEGWESVWRGQTLKMIRSTVDSDTPYFPYCSYCSSRRGFDQEGSMAVDPGSDVYVIPGMEDLQVPFNLRTEESAYAFKQVKSDRSAG